MKAAFFDVGGTLIRPWPSVGAVYARVGERHGFVASSVAMEKAFRNAWHKAKTADGGLTTSEKHWWQQLVFEVLETLQLGGSDAARTMYFEELYNTFASADAWQVFPDVADALHRARGAGLHVGLISNWDERLRQLLTSTGLAQQVDSITISCEVGVEKPAPAIFHAALRAAGVAADDAIHVGDDFETDVRGAAVVGMQGVLIDRTAQATHACPVVRDLGSIAFDSTT